METKETKKIDEPNKNNPVIKNICYEMDTNKLMINDSENNHYLCDIFGRKRIKFLPYITGTLNRYKYPNLLQEKNFSYLQTKNFSPIKSSLRKHTISTFSNNMITNKKQTNYFPTIRKFEGYSKLPRPVGPPFSNVPDYEIKEKDKRKLINDLSSYYDDYLAKNDVIRKNENNGLSYLTGDLNEFDSIRHDTEQSLKLIENTMNNFREEYRLKLNIMHKNPNVKALNQFKKNLLLNKDSKVINGRQLGEPCEKIKKNYRIIQSIVNRCGLSLEKKIDKNNLTNIYNKIKNSKKNKTITKNDSKYNIKNLSIVVGPDRLNDVCQSKDFTVGRFINMDFGMTLDKEKNFMTINNTNTSEISKLPEINKNNAVNKNNESVNKVNNEDIYKETEETATNYNVSKISNKAKTLEEKINDNELSFISYMSENEKKYAKENNVNIKSIKTIKKVGEHSNKLLLGFKEKQRPPKTIFQKSRIQKLKTNGDLYKEDINLLRLTNREAFKIQEQKDLYDLKLLEKKVKISAINANNVMKGKTLKTDKNKNKNDNN